MTDGQDFTYRTTAMKRPVTYSLRRGMLMGPLGMRIPLKDVTRLALVQHKNHGRLVRRLDIFRDRNRDQISVTGEQALARTDDDLTTHLALVASIVEQLQDRNPDMPVVMSETGASRWVMSGLGLLCTLMAAGFALFLLLGHGRLDTLFTFGPMIAALGAFGIVVAWKYRPLKDPHVVPLGKLPPYLAYLAGTLTIEDASAAVGLRTMGDGTITAEPAPAPPQPARDAAPAPRRRTAKSGPRVH